MHSQNIDQAYKRLTRTIDLTRRQPRRLSFWTSYNTEPDWDYVFVEAHTVNADGTATTTGPRCARA